MCICVLCVFEVKTVSCVQHHRISLVISPKKAGQGDRAGAVMPFSEPSVA